MKITPQEFIMKHAAQPYDPAKRREYYLKTRELKGRKLGSGRPPPLKSPSGSLTGVAKKTAKKAPTTNREEIQRRREEVANRVAALNIKLDKLRGILSSLDDQIGKGKSEEDKGKEKEKKKEPTAAEKKEAAKAAKERREKEAKKSPVQAIADVQKKIEAVQEQIREKRIMLQRKAARKAAREEEKPKATPNPRSPRKGRKE